MKYTDDAYKETIEVLINDIYYVEGQSYNTKIARIRTYAEIIVRRLLRWDTEKQLTLGHNTAQQRLTKKKYTEPLLRDSIVKINELGSNRTHTQIVKLATKEEFDTVVENLFNLYAYLFYSFFKKNRFGSNMNIVHAFSILPPIIRAIALEELYKNDSGNDDVIDHLTLAKMKAYGMQTALDWIESNKNDFVKRKLEVPSEYKQQLVSLLGEEVATFTLSQFPNNLYEKCKKKVKDVGSVYQSHKLYSNFEEALTYYREHGHVAGESKDVVEFNELMEFVYCGRREKEKAIEGILDEEYVIDKIIWYVEPTAEENN